ncbi:MAG: DUF5343 domain-containing protein [Candidatus Daviesbacteria bacterium]|nr:DUF5343 domain-containing protein [Candidatus Daviesbacteria bacterium]
MAKKSKKLKRVEETKNDSKPKFPYTITPGALRTVLQEIPKRPKPTSMKLTLLKTWGIRDNNARTVLSVLKTLGLIDGSGSPTPHYTDYMKNDTGASSLANRIRETYAQFFQASNEPHRETQENLRNFFNIHSGGSEATLNHQIQTFKTLCEFANFNTELGSAVNAETNNPKLGTNNTAGASININLHIHLPENKSRADYEEIVKDIGKYIFQK